MQSNKNSGLKGLSEINLKSIKTNEINISGYNFTNTNEYIRG